MGISCQAYLSRVSPQVYLVLLEWQDSLEFSWPPDPEVLLRKFTAPSANILTASGITSCNTTPGHQSPVIMLRGEARSP